MSQSTKICTKCKLNKPLGEFNKDVSRPCGKCPQCKECKKENYLCNKEKVNARNKRYYESNKEKVNARNMAWVTLNKEKVQAYKKQWAEDNRESIKRYKQEWAEKNKEEISSKRAQYRLKNRGILSIKNKSFREENQEAIRLRDRNRYWENPLKFNERARRFREDNLIKVREGYRAYHSANREYRNLKKREYFKTPSGRVASLNARHKRRTLTKQGDVTTEQLLQLTSSAKTCFYCECDLTIVKAHVDHFVPLSKGGEHTISNLVMACPSCNLRKGAKDPMEFIWSHY